MAVFIDTRGHAKLAIAICARCSRKFPYDELRPDPNYPGLMVCPDDLDDYDPWRLPARETEDISLDHARPDTPLSPQYATTVYGQRVIGGVTLLLPSVPWSASTPFAVGAQVTPLDPNSDLTIDETTPTLYQFQCISAGQTGASPPAWPQAVGQMVVDNTVIWQNTGVFIF